VQHPVLKRGDRVRFSCIACGRCCSTGPNVSLTIFDVCRIAKYMGVNWRDLRGKYVIALIADIIPVPALRGLGDVCAFLVFENGLPRCSVYPARPMRCRLYPFLPASPSKLGVLYLDEMCLGVGESEEVEPPWNILEQYYSELREHYKLIYKLVFEEGYEPLEALEKALDIVCGGEVKLDAAASQNASREF